jgi:SNF2 family DNA or RNA helicase
MNAAAILSLKARHKLAMSGTPIENNLGDLYSLFRFLNPAFFYTQKHFEERYLRPIQDDNDEDALKELKTRIYPFILRRLKRDVLKELPEKTEETIFVDLEPAHLAAYHKKRQEYKELLGSALKTNGIQKESLLIFKALSDLRRLATVPEASDYYIVQTSAQISAKRAALLSMVKELVESGHKALVFTNFLAGVELVSQDLGANGIEHLTMTGSTSGRQLLVDRFQNDPKVKVFIMTLKTGGAGLNLTAADYIFILDPWWNVAAENQAIDRAHRFGQTNPVICYRLIARDTIEERILELQQEKARLAATLLASDDASLVKKLTEEDLETLLRG